MDGQTDRLYHTHYTCGKYIDWTREITLPPPLVQDNLWEAMRLFLDARDDKSYIADR